MITALDFWLRVLLVEDDPQLLRAMTRQLRALRCYVEPCESISAVVQQPAYYDIGVFDLELPDGLGLTAACRLIGECRVSRVVFFTGAGDCAALRAARRLGRVVSKADGVDSLVTEVAHLKMLF